MDTQERSKEVSPIAFQQPWWLTTLPKVWSRVIYAEDGQWS